MCITLASQKTWIFWALLWFLAYYSRTGYSTKSIIQLWIKALQIFLWKICSTLKFNLFKRSYQTFKVLQYFLFLAKTRPLPPPQPFISFSKKVWNIFIRHINPTIYYNRFYGDRTLLHISIHSKYKRSFGALRCV